MANNLFTTTQPAGEAFDLSTNGGSVVRVSLVDPNASGPFLIVATLAALALAPAPAGTGTRAQVNDQGIEYALDRSTTFLADGFWIIAATGGGNWFRRSKPFTIANSFLWMCPFSGFVANDRAIYGYGPGAQAAGSLTEEIRLDLAAVVATDNTTLLSVVVDGVGNLWVSASRLVASQPGFTYKLKLSDCLASGVVTPSVKLQQTVVGFSHVWGAFDRGNSLWVANSITGGAVSLAKYGAPSYASSGTTPDAPTPDVTITMNALGAGVGSGSPEYGAFDAQGNIWNSAFSNPGTAQFGAVQMLSAAQIAAGSAAVAAAVVWSGANFKGPVGITFGPTGVIWVCNYNTGGAASFINAHAMQSPVSGNQAALIHLTGINGAEDIRFDTLGNAWVASSDDGKIYFLTPAQLAASGAVVPTRFLGNSNGAFPQTLAYPNDPNRSGLVAAGAPGAG